MQPSPTSETSGPRVPSLRFCIALQYRLRRANHRTGAAPRARSLKDLRPGRRFAIDDTRSAAPKVTSGSVLPGGDGVQDHLDGLFSRRIVRDHNELAVLKVVEDRRVMASALDHHKINVIAR